MKWVQNHTVWGKAELALCGSVVTARFICKCQSLKGICQEAGSSSELLKSHPFHWKMTLMTFVKHPVCVKPFSGSEVL